MISYYFSGENSCEEKYFKVNLECDNIGEINDGAGSSRGYYTVDYSQN